MCAVALTVATATASGLVSDPSSASANAGPRVVVAPKASLVVARDKQLWVWDFGRPVDLIRLAKIRQVTQLLVWVSPGFTRKPAVLDKVRRLVVAATAQHLSVVALSGDPSWASTPQTAGAWAAEVAASGLFTKIHLDIEPNALSDWAGNTDQLARGLLAALDAAGAAGLPVSADIPSWFGQLHVDTDRLDTAVLRRVSDVTIMAYRNTPASVLNAAKAEVAEAARMNRPAFIGVNLAPAGIDPPSTSMLGLPSKTVFAYLRKIDTTAASWPGYAGLAINDSIYLSKL